jgi:hypothetical protein
MTSGEGEQGQPPQWQQPGPPHSGQPPYGPPPYGPPGPHGQQPYGYGPMPSAYRQPPPERKERPLTVRAGLGAFVASIVLSLASSAFAVANWDEFVEQGLAQAPEFQDPEFQESGLDPQAFVEGLATVFLVVSLLFTALYVLFVWFAWRGYNWARIVLFVLGGLGIASGMFTLSGVGAGPSPLPSLTALSIFSFLAVLVGTVLLALKPSNDWYASEKLRRTLTG